MDEYRALPPIEPGQIWLIEHVASFPLCPCDRGALTSANVVIYDRALASLVASILPIGGYAEPMPPKAHTAGPAISPRALDFAADGWSVAQVVEASPEWRARIRCSLGALMPLRRAGDLSVLVITKRAGSSHRERDACLRALPRLLDEFAADDHLTLVFGSAVARHPARPDAIAGNGLAG